MLDFSNLSLLFLLVSLAKSSVNSVDLFKEPTFGLTSLCSFSILCLISTPIFIISFLLLALVLVCSSFSLNGLR